MSEEEGEAMSDYPIEECLPLAEKIIEQGGAVHQKWTCHHCGSRQTMDTPNQFFRSGRCEACDKITIINKCNYMAVLPIGGKR